ncbi:alpha-2-macroglobulin family protein [Nakamurella aerolata]|uniref:Alpha-2-macroglobulin family protein n=1 Tax=Nakamurella aerolata TaxID=1656892 RepID=A0A849A996_9ACTN|nr:alpha-2-macroglobulin family protein [Nakamurella aerolata]NNG36143.1 hypothetical protein [Nakamurella aerolata]
MSNLGTNQRAAGGVRGSLRRHRRWWVLGAAALALIVLVTTVVVTGGGSNPAGRPGPAGASSGENEPSAPGSGPGSGSGATTEPGGGNATPGQGRVLPAGLRLSAGSGPATPAAETPVADGTPLDQQTLGRLLGRLPAWTPTATGGSPYRWPAQTIKKPESTQQNNQRFPSAAASQNPPQKPAGTPGGPLTVLRIQPEGKVAIAPNLSITFSQPMVPVTTVGQLKDLPVPARLSPDVPGRWEWIGTSTLRFVAETGSKKAPVDRLPMATDYTVTIPVGTRSQSGNALAKPVTARFSTPPPSVTSFTPGDEEPTALRPVLVAVFDQRIEEKTLLPKLSLTAGDTSWPIRKATAAEIDADHQAARTIDSATPGRFIAVVPERDLPVGTSATLTVAPGTPSAEGPLPTMSEQRFSFTTHGPMELTTTDCGGATCGPGSSLQLTFSNPIDEKAFDPGTVAITPKLDGAVVAASGQGIVITGPTAARTTYRIRVDAGLKDTFGQRLAAPVDTTISIGAAQQQLSAFDSPVTTVDPMLDKPQISVTSAIHRQVRVRVYAVELEDWAGYLAWYVKANQSDAPIAPPTSWRQLSDRTLPVNRPGDSLSTTAIDLSADLNAQRRQAVVLVEPTEPVTGDGKYANRPSASWVQLTTIGVDTVADAGNATTWVTDLRDGKPIAGVQVQLIGPGGATGDSVTTDAKGLARLPLDAGGTALLATGDEQQALLPASLWNDIGWRRADQPNRLLWYLTDDRQTYRPGEKVSVKGWVRQQSSDPATRLSIPGTGTVRWSATDGNGVSIGRGTAKVNGSGGFDLTVTVPAGANLGAARLSTTLTGSAESADTGEHTFQIADFRTPAFEVATRRVDTAPAVRGSDLAVQADATYYAGGALGEATVDWQVRTAEASYAPPGWQQFSFGRWRPWWLSEGVARSQYGDVMPPGPGGTRDDNVQHFSGTTDGAGRDYLDVQVGDLGADTAGYPVTVTAQASVTDVNRQQIADSTDVVVHPADAYVGVSGDGTFIGRGQPLTVNLIATDIAGTAVAGRAITVTAAKVTSSWAGGETSETLSDKQTCTVRSTAKPVDCTFRPKAGGQYRITATVTDAKGRTSRTEVSRWVAGRDDSIDTRVDQQQLTLIPDKKQYRPGDTAVLFVQGPIAAGTGLITLNHNGIVSSNTFTVQDGTAQVRVPVTDALLPAVTANVEVVGTVPRGTAPGNRPAYATGRVDLAVSTAGRELTVTAKPRQQAVKPGGKTTVDVTVKDANGKPVQGSEFEVAVVDEAVLAQSDYQLADPLAAFYPVGNTEVDTRFGRSLVMLGPQQLSPQSGGDSTAAGAMESVAGGSAAGAATGDQRTAAQGDQGAPAAAAPAKSGPTQPQIQLRNNFDALALFRPSVLTGPDGSAAVPVTLPDNLTRYRVMVVAVAGEAQFGTGEATLTAALPLTVRPTAPRFLNFGDKAEVPVLVQNTTDTPQTAQVALQGANLTVAGAGTGATAGAVGKQVQVPAKSRVEVRFAVTADRAGTAEFRVAAAAADDPAAADAAQLTLPVYTPSTSEAFASYGSLDGNTVLDQRVQSPTGVIDAFGGLQVSTSSTALTRLSDALGYLADYDYDSSDAMATKVLAIASVGSVLQSFSAPELPSPDALRKQVNGNIDKLIRLQNDDGGYPFWRKGEKSQPFTSVQATQALLVAKKNGFDGASAGRRDAAVRSALQYLAKIRDLGGAPDARPAETGAGKDAGPAADPAAPIGAEQGNAYWYEHQNLRDDRAEAFTSWLQGGVYSYSYQARATVPGTFVAPPTKAEQMYAPETFGRSASDRVVIG